MQPLREALPKIISGVAVTAIVGISAALFPGGWATVGKCVVDVAVASWLWIAAPAEVPTGILIAMGLCTTAAAVVSALRFYASRSAKPGPVLPASDEVLGIIWRWSPSTYGRFEGMASFCPKCDYQVYARDAAPYAYVHETSYSCENCNWRSQVFDVAPEELEDRVRRDLQRKARQLLREGDAD